MADRDPYPSEKQDRFIVRLPDGMRDRIKAAAEAHNRSMNAEIVATLEEKYPAPAPSYRDLLAMTLDFVVDSGFSTKTEADKLKLLKVIDQLPPETGEDIAKHGVATLLEGFERQIAEFRKSQSGVSPHDEQ